MTARPSYKGVGNYVKERGMTYPKKKVTPSTIPKDGLFFVKKKEPQKGFVGKTRTRVA